MMKGHPLRSKGNAVKRATVFFVLLCMLAAAFASYALPVYAKKKPEAKKTVRVGWYDSSFNRMDKFGRRSGYAYDYQQKISSYTGWEYEYVEGSWPELLEMLKKGEIDLMSDVSYTKERAGEMLFPLFPMGAESYYLFITPDNTSIKPGQYSTLNGIKVGINQGSVQERLFREWQKDNGVDAQIVSLTGTEQESLEMLTGGDIDAYLTLDSYGDISKYVPIMRIGQSEYYFAINKNRPDLLEDINYALGTIQEKNRYYNQELYEKYAEAAGTNAFMDAEESAWLKEHGAVRVGYVDDYLPFCDANASGELEGVLQEYLSCAAACAQNAVIEFDTRPYRSVEEALGALKAGEVDCVFPLHMSAYDSEEWGVYVTSPIMQAEMYIYGPAAGQVKALREEKRNVSIRKGNINEELFVKDYFPEWTTVAAANMEESFRDVSKGAADATLLSGYRVGLMENLIEKYDMTAQTTGASMSFAFAVRRGDITLYSILDKTVNLVPVAMIEASLASYSAPDDKVALAHFVRVHLTAVILSILFLAGMAVFFQLRHTRRLKEELEQRLALQETIIEQERQKHESDEMINAMSSDYRSVFYVDIDGDRAICYRANEDLKNGVREGDTFSFSERFSQYAQNFVAEADREGFLDFIRPDNIRKGLAKEEIISYRYLVNLYGEDRYELLRMASVGNADTGGIHAIGVGFTDVDSITRKELEKNDALSDALNQAEEANAAKTAFLSSMSHEIRTPMNAIIGFNNIALHEPGLTEGVKECLEKIGASADHLLHLINNILDMSRIESGRMTLRYEEFSFRGMLEQINTMISGQCKDKGLTYNCVVKGRVDEYYIGDDMKLKQVLLNILGNAVKYTPAPGTVTFTVEPLHTFDDNVSLRFVMEDTGIGMDKEFLPKVFGAFAQEDEGLANKYGSTGLGMAIAKSIVEMMNGNIEVESEKGKGTTFTVTVTLRLSDKRNDTVETEVRPQDLHVLIIDDDPDALDQAKRVMDQVGIRSDTCTSGQEAYEMLRIEDARHEAYNLILVDWKMDVEDGIAVTRKIREQYKDNTAIIILTAYDWEEVEEEAFDAGVDGFIAKPLFVSKVLKEFEKALIKKKYDAEQAPKTDLTGKRILIAEDMLINAEIVKRLLEMNNMEVDVAENGQICVDMFRESPEGTYDAILMDIRMPVLDGLGAAEAIRSLGTEEAGSIPIIAMTANAFDEDVQRSLQAGMNAHLTKPLDATRLLETLQTLVCESQLKNAVKN